MPLTAEGSPLVSGVAPKAQDKTVKVKVLRAFLIKGVRQEVNKEFDMDKRLALELRAMNKVEFVKAAEPAPAKAKKES